MQFSLGFSPCPNDTFIFDALVNNKIDTEGINFNVFLEDVQTLNNWALKQQLQITKVSYGVLPFILQNYLLLNSGGALGKGVGPLLICNNNNNSIDIDKALVAIPGENTTANLLFSLAYPNAKNKRYLVFNQIEQAILNNTVDAGVIIHENRFTYQNKGLKKIIDLGDFWEQKLNLPIPLGGIVVNKSIPLEVAKKIDGLIQKSVLYAFKNYPTITNYVKQYAQEMSDDVMRQHINLYVNNFSISLGNEGQQAVQQFINLYKQLNPAIQVNKKFFVN